jgi:hypothetical protein
MNWKARKTDSSHFLFLPFRSHLNYAKRLENLLMPL